MRTATRVTPGTASLISSNRFVFNAWPSVVTPVTLPPGRARLVTIPSPTGSPVVTITIGMVPVALLAASAPGLDPVRMTSTRCRTSSAASPGSRSGLPSANRVSTVKLWPLDPPQIAQPLPKGFEIGHVSLCRLRRQPPDPGCPLLGLLRGGGERRAEGAERKGDNQSKSLVDHLASRLLNSAPDCSSTALSRSAYSDPIRAPAAFARSGRLRRSSTPFSSRDVGAPTETAGNCD